MLSPHCRTTWKNAIPKAHILQKDDDNNKIRQYRTTTILSVCLPFVVHLSAVCVCSSFSLFHWFSVYSIALFPFLLCFLRRQRSVVLHTLLSSWLCCCGFQCSISPWMFNLHFTLSTRTSHTVKGCTICITYSCWSTSNNFNIYWEVKHHVCKYVMH